MIRAMNNLPIFTIGIVSELLEVHPETIRVWERYGIIRPQRRSGKRFYSKTDLKRLRFIKKLITEQLNLPAIRHYLRLYPCWDMDDCPTCMQVSEFKVCAKPCWREENKYCQVYGKKDMCLDCEFGKRHVTKICSY